MAGMVSIADAGITQIASGASRAAKFGKKFEPVINQIACDGPNWKVLAQDAKAGKHKIRLNA